MDRDAWKVVFTRKSPLFIVVTIAYLTLAGFVKWKFAPPIESLWYLAGGILGLYFLDLAEAFFRLTPSPFRSVIFTAAFAGVSFFVISSSGSMLASGLVLSLYITLMLWQVGEWRLNRNLNSWYQMVAGPVSAATQQRLLLAFIALFIVESLIFIR